MKNADFTEQWTAMQKTFLPTSDNAQRFWENQDKVLDSMQALANAWFERRHAGTHKARVAAERMCETQTFVDLIQAYQEWASGAFERIMEARYRLKAAEISADALTPQLTGLIAQICGAA